MRYCSGLFLSSPALARAAAAAVAIVSFSIVSSLGARLAMHEDPPALDTDLVGGDVNLGVVQALSSAQVEGLLEDGRGDLGNAAPVADDSPGQHVGLAEGIEIAERVDGVARANDRHLPAPDQRADASPGDDVIDSADVLPLRRIEIEGHRGH